MAQHGYLREYDEGSDRGDDRERSERDWRERDRGWADERDRGPGAMFGDRDHDHYEDRDRGFLGRMGDEARSWFRDDERDFGGERGRSSSSRGGQQRGSARSGYGREHGYGGFQGDFSRSGREQGGFGGYRDYEQGRRSFSAHPDDHYLSWRQKQIEALDRDYEEYCRDCEQRFQQDFDSWRQNRQQNRGQSQQGSSSGEALAGGDASTTTTDVEGATSSPMGAATMGTNNSENTATAPSTTGRGRR